MNETTQVNEGTQAIEEYELAHRYLRGRWDETISYYQELVTTAILMGEDVSEKRFLQMMGLYCLALVYQRKGNFRVAFRYCRRALDLSDESVAPLIDRCLALQETLARKM